MSHDRGAARASAPASAPGGTSSTSSPSMAALRVALDDAVTQLEVGIAARDYFAANYWVTRARWHLATAGHHLGVGAAASSDEQDELDRLRALRARFDRAAAVAPDGGEPSLTARSHWLARLGAEAPAATPASAVAAPAPAPTVTAPVTAAPPATDVTASFVQSPLRPENTRSLYGDLFDVVLPGPSLWLDHQRHSPDPVDRHLADWGWDLTHDAPYLTGFASGSAQGTTRALRDFLKGVPQAAELVYEVVEAFTFGRTVELLRKAARSIRELVTATPQLARWFVDRWNAPDSFARGEFRGEACSYGVTMIALAIVAAYGGPLAELAGDFAVVIRLIELVDLASDITTLLRPLGLLGKSARAARAADTAVHDASTLAHDAARATHLAADVHDAARSAERLDELAAELPLDLRRQVAVVENADLRGATVHVVYRDGDVRIEVGPAAEPRHVGHHVATARMALRYQGPLGQVRRLLDAILTKLRLSPGFGTEGFEARAEVQKLLAIRADLERTQTHLVGGLDEITGADPAQLERELADIQDQLDDHAARIDSYAPGRGFIAADDRAEVVVQVGDVQSEVEEDAGNVMLSYRAVDDRGHSYDLGRARISLDEDGRPADGPWFTLDNQVADRSVIVVDSSRRRVSLTGHAIDQATAYFRRRFGHDPEALPGHLAWKNLENFQREFARRRTMGIHDAAQAAIREISFGRHRAARGYTEFDVNLDRFETIVLPDGTVLDDVPQRVDVVARRPTRGVGR